MITGACFSRPRSMARVIFSPTTEPMLPPMKPKSKTPMTTGSPSISPSPQRIASPPAALLHRRPDAVLVLLGVLEVEKVDRLHLAVHLD